MRLSGTPFLMAAIHSDESGGYLKAGGFSSAELSNVHNYVFLDVTDQSWRRLIATNDSLITEIEQLPDSGDGGTVAGPLNDGKGRVQWLIFHVVKQDTNHNKVLDREDHYTLAASDAGGRGYTELIGDIRELYGRSLRDPNALVVIYQSAGVKLVSVIDLPGRVVTSTAPLPALGPDVK